MSNLKKDFSFSNPRLQAEFDNWPSGSKTVKCKFVIENKKGKYRVVRTTDNGGGIWNKPKLHTFGDEAVIVDGSDALNNDRKTYVLQMVRDYGFINVIRWDLMHEGNVSMRDQPERFEELKNLILSIY